MQEKVVPRAFYFQPAPVVAKQLVGAHLVRNFHGEQLSARIVETEAYLSSNDLAAHAAKGNTKRTRVMFGPPGFTYVYRIHRYYCLNIVTEPETVPGCVLIRAVEPLQGIETMRQNRRLALSKAVTLTNGPGKLCQALDINSNHYGVDVTDVASALFITYPIGSVRAITCSKRIGISRATELPLRYYSTDNPFVSRYV